MRAVWVLGLLFFPCLKTLAQLVDVNGKVTDKQGKPAAFTSIWIDSNNDGSITNEKGEYLLRLKPGRYQISFRNIDYEPLIKEVAVGGKQVRYDIELSLKAPNDIAQSAADSIVRKVIAKRKSYKAQLPAYSGHLYTKALQQLDGAPKVFLKNDIAHQLNLNPDRKGIISLSESIARFHTRSTDYIKEQLDAAKLTTSSEAFGFNSAAELHIDLYRNYLLFNGLCDHAFLSPIAGNAHVFYRYRLTRKFTDQGKQIDEINVQPK